MQGDDQERFEDYLELEQFIEELQAGHVAHPPAELTPDKANIYRMAALFRSASPDAAEVRPEFAAELHARLEEEIKQQQARRKRPKLFPFRGNKQEPDGGQDSNNGKRNVSRRALITGGAAVAASLVAGAALMHEADMATSHSAQTSTTTTQQWPEQLIGDGQATSWHFVIPLAELGNKVVRFATDTIVGYLTFDDTKGDPDEGKLVAMSAACTHMGCLVQWQSAEQRFVCPCHGGLFTEYGEPDPKSPMRYLIALPRLNTKVENGNIYVEVPDNGSAVGKS